MNGGISCVRRFSVNYIHCCILAIPRIKVLCHVVYGYACCVRFMLSVLTFSCWLGNSSDTGKRGGGGGLR